MERIGLFGGSFNPPHIGHTKMAKLFVKELNLDRIIFIPAYISPFKQNERDLTSVSTKYRIAMLELAIEYIDKAEISYFEIQKGGVSYSIDTVKYFSNLYSHSKLFVLIGLDNALTFDKWERFKEILDYVSLSIVARENIIDESIIRKLNKIIGENNYNIIDAPLINISSSQLRKQIKNNEKTENYILPNVKKYILENKLYQN